MSSVSKMNLIGQIPGTITNDDAAAGNVGECIRQTRVVSGSAGITTATPLNVTTAIVLTPGDWDVVGSITYNPSATTNVQHTYVNISTVSATVPAASAAGVPSSTGE